jgi:hypothetical protein
VKIITKKNIWLSIIIVALSFPIELFASRVSFLNLTISRIFFWTGIGIFAIFTSLEIFASVYDYVNDNFTTPRKKLAEVKERISNERNKIKDFLKFDYEGKSVEELRDHYWKLEEAEFSKEALAPYLIDWYNHIDDIHLQIKEDELERQLDDFRNEKEVLENEIKKIEQEKKNLLTSEEEQQVTEREELLQECENKIQIEATNLTEEQKKWLEEIGYQRTHQWCIHKKDSREFMIKPRHNEGLSHAYLTGAIYEYAKELDSDTLLPTTKTADVIFTSAGIRFAIEIETGKVHEKNKKQLIEKVKILNENFPGTWFFVVTNKNLISKYRKFGEVVDRSNVIEKINDIFYPGGMQENTP